MKAITLALVLPLAAPARAAAEPPALKLEQVAVIPASYPTFSADMSLAAAHPDKSLDVDVWRTSDGRQVGRIRLPAIKKLDENDYFSYYPSAFSADKRFLLVSQEHHRDWKEGEWGMYLADLSSEKAKLLVLERKNCTHQRPKDKNDLQPYLCPNAMGEFSPDGKTLAVYAHGFDRQVTEPGEAPNGEFTTLLMEADGKILSRKDDAASAGNKFSYSVWYGPDGRLRRVSSDESSCELLDAESGERAAFLDGCTSKDSVSRRGGLLEAYAYPTYKYWDPKDGRRVEPACEGCVLGRAGRYLFSLDERARKLQVFEDVAGKRALLGEAALPEGASNPLNVSDDGRLVALHGGENATLVFKTGLAAAGGAAAALAAAPETPKVDVDSPPAAKTRLDPDAYAVVIGIEKYRQEGIPAVDFAARDARTVYAYLTGAMGYDPKNVVLLTDDQATKTDLQKNLKSWLANRVDAKSRVFIYYAGHGSPNPATGEGYLMPYEADPNYLADTAFPVATLYAELAKLPTKDITVVLDACFSGQGGRSLIAKGARPLVSARAAAAPPNAVVIAAARASQISASDPERRHGLLTEYLLEGLHGAADADGDGKITVAEAFAYLKPAVERAARLQNIEQTPTLAGAPGAEPWLVLAKPHAP